MSSPPSKSSLPSLIAVLAACLVAVLIYYLAFPAAHPQKTEAADAPKDDGSASGDKVTLNDKQLAAIQIESVGTRAFRVLKQELGSVAYHDKLSAPDARADSTSKFIVANVMESDSPLIRVGQPVEAKIQAYPDRLFTGKVVALGVSIYDAGGNPAVDPGTHRIAVRCEVDDPKNELYPGMFANVAIEVESPVTTVALPQEGVVREGDGTMTAWVTTDRHQFAKRTIKVGLQQDGYDQVLDGLQAGDLVATKNAVFLSNMNNSDTDSP